MFATLVGTDTGRMDHQSLFDDLRAAAIALGFEAPAVRAPIQPDGPLDRWTLEQQGPPDRKADFLLAVMAPRVPGVSPLFPVFKTISGHLFAVVVLDSAFLVSREDRRDVEEVDSQASVAKQFQAFLEWLQRGRTSEHRV
jgi:hypothetical protein